MRTIAPTPRDIERFNAKVKPDGDCLIWQGARLKQSQGYGRFSMKVNGKPDQPLAHRVSYTITYGPIPDGMQVDHICHNHACVSPKHLRAVTQKQNQENHAGAKADSTTGVRGVFWHKRANKYVTWITHNKQKITAGTYDTLEAAERAVIAKRNELFTHNEMDRVA